jgi:hypothetical protein
MHETAQKYSDAQYLAAELFDDGDAEIRAYQKKIVTTRKGHRCAAGDVLHEPHQIAAQTRAVKESAFVEGEWGTAYSCLTCVDKWLDEINAALTAAPVEGGEGK